MPKKLHNRFSTNPTNIDMPRSKFDRPYNNKLTTSAGRLTPIYFDEVLPGDTVKMKVSSIIRMNTPIFATMDNSYCDFYFFFVPNRLVWEHWVDFMGENRETYWDNSTEYEIPMIKANKNFDIKDRGESAIGERYKYKYCVEKGSVADYMGIPISDANNTDTYPAIGEFKMSALPFRAYALIYNEWFRDENTMSPYVVDKGDTAPDLMTFYGETSTADDLQYMQSGGLPCANVCKFHDYFTSALPAPQKGPDVLMPIGNNAPVVGNGLTLGLTDGTNNAGLAVSASTAMINLNGVYGTNAGTDNAGTGIGLNKSLGVTTEPEKSGLIADLSVATGATINALRQAFAIQRMLEKDARGGTRYTELIHTHFGVTSPDARLQRPEYLGGTRVTINIDQVLQTSATNEVTPQGNVAGYSLTAMSDELFTKSFTEHGMLMGFMVIRPEHSYQQGLPKYFSKKSRYDFYFPTLANIGEQPIYKKELMLKGNVSGTGDDEAFGYQEAWAEYRYKPNTVAGAFRSVYKETLDAWHYADNYSVGYQPVISERFIKETGSTIDRTIAVTQQLEDQFQADLYFDTTWVRAMPMYSIPGLIDHH